jgi:tRNA/tmRNA/rRNA uracil-C5-methylase (TrmA/RlmC/RlmD family)
MHKNKGFNDSTGKDKSEILPYLNRLERETKIQFTGPEPLASMNYDDEIRAKDRAFSSYWNDITGSCSAGVITPSPMPRKYRTTTKRRIHRTSRGILLCSDESSLTDKPSLLEPDTHSMAYTVLGELLNKTINSHIVKSLNFVIIRGDYETHAVIFNLKKINADIVKGYTGIAEKLKHSMGNLSSAYLFHDPEGSKYYLNTSSETDGNRLKRLFGSRSLSLKTEGITYKFSPDGFSQVNLSICSAMLQTAGSLLAHGSGSRLIDLYCGYGFFSCYLARSFEEIAGIDFSSSSIESARENMKMLRVKTKWTFHSKKVDRRSLSDSLPEPGKPEYIILDPPRNGTAPAVIEIVAARQPELVLHIFCGVETIPGEMTRWNKCGYEAVKCIPLDMFPGTPDVEVMVLLKKIQSGKTSSRSKSGR